MNSAPAVFAEAFRQRQVVHGQIAPADEKDAEFLVAADGMTAALNRDRPRDGRQRQTQCDVLGDGNDVVTTSGWTVPDRLIGIGCANAVAQGTYASEWSCACRAGRCRFDCADLAGSAVRTRRADLVLLQAE